MFSISFNPIILHKNSSGCLETHQFIRQNITYSYFCPSLMMIKRTEVRRWFCPTYCFALRIRKVCEFTEERTVLMINYFGKVFDSIHQAYARNYCTIQRRITASKQTHNFWRKARPMCFI